MAEQISIFTLNGFSEDPLFEKIVQLQVGEHVIIQNFKVARTNKFYEIQNDEIHECFHNPQECCNYIDRNLN
ncbi:hypothetical protein ACQKMD_07485 [Viridibacillus sp. NPDC096237]|uniref:hypothetical protein n=1 Tax=Viridibacillus sp. NPDC096237 TaxID=3390721 RepID=UPI003CFDE2C2